MSFVRYDLPEVERCWVSIRRHKGGAYRVHVGCHAEGISPATVIWGTRDQQSAADRKLLLGGPSPVIDSVGRDPATRAVEVNGAEVDS